MNKRRKKMKALTQHDVIRSIRKPRVRSTWVKTKKPYSRKDKAWKKEA